MAKYTIELKTMMNDESIKPLLDEALSKYPLYKPNTDDEYVLSLIPTREELNRKILNHYRRYEIGFETIAEFLEELEITMDEIMPYYNQLYKSVEIMGLIDDPFGNVDVTETFTETRAGTNKVNDTTNTLTESDDHNTVNSSAQDSSSTESNVNSNSKNVESDTPQGNLGVTAENIDDVTHASKINWNKNTSNDSASTSGSSSTESETEGYSSSEANTTHNSQGETSETTEHTFTKKGNQGVNTYAHDMEELRTTFIDVTKQIIENEELKNLFMLVF